MTIKVHGAHHIGSNRISMDPNMRQDRPENVDLAYFTHGALQWQIIPLHAGHDGLHYALYRSWHC